MDSGLGSDSKSNTPMAVFLALIMVLSGMTLLAAHAGAGHDNPAAQDRHQFTYRPDGRSSDSGPLAGVPTLDRLGLYMNHTSSDELLKPRTFADQINSSLRVYGEAAEWHQQPGESNAQFKARQQGSGQVKPGHAPDTYLDRNITGDPINPDHEAPWRPSIVPKDTVTFNPAVIDHLDRGDMQSCRQNDPSVGDASLKKNLRIWYEPGHEYLGPRTDGIDFDEDQNSGQEKEGYYDGTTDLFTPPTSADTVVVESTYSMLDEGADWSHAALCDGNQFRFPIQGTNYNITTSRCTERNVNHSQPGVDTLRSVTVQNITPREKDAQGEITRPGFARIQRTVSFDAPCDTFQFLDHVYQYLGFGQNSQGELGAIIKVFYAGNTVLDKGREHTFFNQGGTETWWFDRDNARFASAVHQSPAQRTAFVQFTNDTTFPSDENPDGPLRNVIIGKELMTGDTYYVDGVRYDVPLMSIRSDTGNKGSDELLSITTRTPLPKSDGDPAVEPGETARTGQSGFECSWTSVHSTESTPEEMIETRNREILRPAVNQNGHLEEGCQVSDWSTVTSQWLVNFDAFDPIPVDPPFNREDYEQVDDTDVIQWRQGEDNTEDFFPFGEKNDVNGLPKFELGHAFLTQSGPGAQTNNGNDVIVVDGDCREEGTGQPFDPNSGWFFTGPDRVRATTFCGWVEHFEVEHTGLEDPSHTRERFSITRGINHDLWDSAVNPGIGAIESNFFWIQEGCEDRYNTNLHQIFEEDPSTGDTEFTKFEVNTHPCRYTSFVLPDASNTDDPIRKTFDGDQPVSQMMADLDTNHPDPPAKGDPTVGDDGYRLLGGDYLVTTSFGLQDSADTDEGWEPRFAFAFDPLADTATASSTGPIHHKYSLNQIDLYVNEVPNATGALESTVRLYGEEGAGADGHQPSDRSAPVVYTDPEAPFDPSRIEKDSATFNPALIQHTDEDFTGFADTFSWITSCRGDANLKKHLRTWYEPRHDYTGPLINDGTSERPTEADVVNVESTYMLTEGDSNEPAALCPGKSLFPFPTEGGNYNTTDLTDADNAPCSSPEVAPLINATGHGQPGLDTMRAVEVGRVFPQDSATPGLDGGLELERTLSLEKCETVQLFDMIVQYRGMNSAEDRAIFSAWYAGNTFPEKKTSQLQSFTVGGDRAYIGQTEICGSGASPSCPGNTRPAMTQNTYIDVRFFSPDIVRLTLGEEIRGGDTFYVDGVRYDVGAIHTDNVDADGDGSPEDVAKYITLRTPLPKSEPSPIDSSISDSDAPCGNWTTVPEQQADHPEQREVLKDGQCQVEDWSVYTSQWIVNICPDCPIPVDPPFNRNYTQVDDTDVLLWKQGEDNTEPAFPFGPIEENGLPMFPQGHTFLTRERPQCDDDPRTGAIERPATPADARFCAWIEFFDAEPTSNQQLLQRVQSMEQSPVNGEDLWNNDTTPNRTLEPNFHYKREWCDDRLNTNRPEVLEVPSGDPPEWRVDVVISEPCRYTEFDLPNRTNEASELAGFLDDLKGDITPQGLVKLLGGDYLITTSLKLETGGGQVSGTSATFSPYDFDQNCDLETVPELTTAVRDFLSGRIDGLDMLDVAKAWLHSPYC